MTLYLGSGFFKDSFDETQGNVGRCYRPQRGRRLREMLLRRCIILASALVSQLRPFRELTLHHKTGPSNK